MVTWSKQELLKLIDIWADDRIQSELEVCHQNASQEKYVKLGMTEHLNNAVLNGTGQGRKDFDAMNTVLGNKPATAPSVVLDTLASQENDQDNNSRGDIIDKEDESLFIEHNEGTSTSQSLLYDCTEYTTV